MPLLAHTLHPTHHLFSVSPGSKAIKLHFLSHQPSVKTLNRRPCRKFTRSIRRLAHTSVPSQPLSCTPFLLRSVALVTPCRRRLAHSFHAAAAGLAPKKFMATQARGFLFLPLYGFFFRLCLRYCVADMFRCFREQRAQLQVAGLAATAGGSRSRRATGPLATPPF